MKKLTVIIEQTKTGYSAYFKNKDIAVYTTGKTVASTLRNLAAAYKFSLEK